MTRIPLAIKLVPGNKADCESFMETYNDMLVKTSDTEELKETNYRRIFLLDSAYDSLRKKINDLGYVAIIPQNKRNTKDENKIIHFTKQEKVYYKKRIIVENANSWIKQYPKFFI